MSNCKNPKIMSVSFVGSAGIPNKYGGFESFLENCGPVIANHVKSVSVTCDKQLYVNDLDVDYKGVKRVFVNIRANGASSVLHDLVAFFRVFKFSTHIVVLGVSGGIWFPLFYFMCLVFDKKLLINIDGVEWRRNKFTKSKKIILRAFDYLAQKFSSTVIYDNESLSGYVIKSARNRAVQIGYSGDHVRRLVNYKMVDSTALTICRIESENNIELLIEGFLKSNLKNYTIVGNWSNSEYGRELRSRYINEVRLELLDPIYDPIRLAELRECCSIYLHGHSVGGTNPSLVEMLFYDCGILCFDVNYNRSTAHEGACYFIDAISLSENINLILRGRAGGDLNARLALRQKYTSKIIVQEYIKALQ